jgi:SAM-dependent methyltransferase
MTDVRSSRPGTNPERIRAALRDSGVSILRMWIPQTAFARWVEWSDYERRYPKYVRRFPAGSALTKKLLEHFLSIDLLGLPSTGTVVDVGSRESPFADVVARMTPGLRVVRADLAYSPGWSGDDLGCDAASLELERESVDRVFYHCSFEHFEGDRDTRAISEIARVLVPGGAAVIIPLWLAEHAFNETDDKAHTPGVEFDGDTAICIGPWSYRFARFYDTDSLCRRVVHAASVNGLVTDVTYFANWSLWPRAPRFAMVLRRTR